MKELILKLARLLNEHQIRFLIFGGVASVRYGAPRATFDIDIVLKKDDVPANFIEILDSAKIYPVEEISIRDLIESSYTAFIDDEDNEVDFWTRVDGFKFDNEAWKHRSDEKIDNVVVHFMSPEDMMVSKLAINQTEDNNIDILSILINEADKFDLDYFLRRIKQFGMNDKMRDLKIRINQLSEDKEIEPYLKKVITILGEIEK